MHLLTQRRNRTYALVLDGEARRVVTTGTAKVKQDTGTRRPVRHHLVLDHTELQLVALRIRMLTQLAAEEADGRGAESCQPGRHRLPGHTPGRTGTADSRG